MTGINHKDYSSLRDNIDQPLYNRAVQGAYPPGSTIKPMEAMGGLHYGIVDWSTAISDPGYFHLPGDSHKFRDWKNWSWHREHAQSHYHVLRYLFLYFGKSNGHRPDEPMDAPIWLWSKTGVDLPSESEGLYPSPEWKMRTRKTKWMKGETISVSIGQGAFTATPLQLAMATAITANHGSHVVPHVLRASHGAKPLQSVMRLMEKLISTVQTKTG